MTYENTDTGTTRKGFYIIVWFFILSFVIYFIVFSIFINKRKAYYMIMINPAHGGKQAQASALDGDRYDILSGAYKQDYDAGYSDIHTANPKINEFGLLLKLSKKVQEKLNLTQSMFKWKQFEEMLKKYGVRSKYPRVIFDAVLLKEHDHAYYEKKKEKDVNAHFRMFNFRSTGFFKTEKKGILSSLNRIRPHLVINLDFNYRSDDDKGLFSINLPDYSFFNSIKEKLAGKSRDFSSANKEIIDNWYGKDRNAKMKNLIDDVWVYYTGYLPDRTFYQASDQFMGTGYNMVSWPLRDRKYAENFVHPEINPQYQKELKNFIAQGAFWKREEQPEESWKRKAGDQGVPDALYAGEEVIKYLKYVLEKTGIKTIKKSAPVYSIESISLYTYSLVININLGSILDPETRYFYKQHTDLAAEAICLGLYSICAGYELKELPELSDNPVNFKKYKKSKYFGMIKKKFY